jgi:ceramide glucosyltransferase
MPSVHLLAVTIAFASLGAAAVYAVLALVAVLAWNRRRTTIRPHPLPPVTVLKPLCGWEPGLYANLRSFCEQRYPEYQIIFGVRDRADPALAVVERLVAEFPSIPMGVVVNPQLHGSNYKVSNLINMVASARHEVLIIADSDASVETDYLSMVTTPLLDPKVGLVTSIYRDVPTKSIWSRLGAMYINEWYMPSVLIAWFFGHQGYVSGQTMCLSRHTLQAVGGLESIANHLADDHRLGQLVCGLGLHIALSPYVVRAEHHEPSWDSLVRHEVRWMRTIRALQPRSYWFLFLSFSLPLAILGLLLSPAGGLGGLAAWALFLTASLARLGLHFVPWLRGTRPLFADLCLVPAQDLLLVWVWVRALFTSRISWRGNEFDVGADGVLRRLS